MITQELEFIRNEISALLDFEFNHKIETIDVEGVYAKLQGNTLYIGTQSKSCYARALTLAAKAISEGKTEFEIVQNAHFKTCGALIDMSRNGVMTVSSAPVCGQCADACPEWCAGNISPFQSSYRFPGACRPDAVPNHCLDEHRSPFRLSSA